MAGASQRSVIERIGVSDIGSRTGSEDSLAGRSVFIAGETGMAGRAIVARLRRAGCRLLSAPHSVLDLTKRSDTFAWFEHNRPEIVVLAAARVGGVLANLQMPAEFLSENLAIANNVIGAAHSFGVERLVYVASAAAYPLDAHQPIQEEALLTGSVDPTHYGYAIAKIAGIALCNSYRSQYGRNYFSVLPTNLYGPFVQADLTTSHVVAALIRKVEEAVREKSDTVTAWGTGAARRDLLHTDDLAEACVSLLRHGKVSGHINVGSGQDVTIRELAELICEVGGYEGAIRWDRSKPDGAPRRLLATELINSLGWRPRIGLREGLRTVFEGYRAGC